MKNTVIKSGDIAIKKQEFYQYKIPISIKNIDINKKVVSNKVCFGKKDFIYFFDYIDAKEIRRL